MPWQGIALSTELLPQSITNEVLKIILRGFQVNGKLQTNRNRMKRIIARKLRKWIYLIVLGLILYILGYSIAKIEIFKREETQGSITLINFVEAC